MIGRAFLRKDPFDVWADGTQVRNGTYIGDIATGMITAAENIDDGTAVNLGTEERIRVIGAVEEILNFTDFHLEIKYLTHMPTGPLNRVASNKRAQDLLGCEPKTHFVDELHRTIDWYFSTKNKKDTDNNFDKLLTDR